MGAPTTIQEAKKAQQLDRIARKAAIETDEDAMEYAVWFGNQPAELARSEQHTKHQAALRAAEVTAETLGIAEITGVKLDEARHDHAVAVLVAERAKPGREHASLSLSAVGSN